MFHFIILIMFQNGHMQCPPHVGISDLRHACNFLLVPFNVNTVRCDDLARLLHELSNIGAQDQFESFINSHLMKAMATATLVCVPTSYYLV
jgi:BTB/POZ domain-containing protein 10